MKEIFGTILYDHVELAEMLGVTTTTIRRYMHSDRLHGKIIGGRWHFTEKQIKDFLEEPDVLTRSRKKITGVSTSGNDNLRK